MSASPTYYGPCGEVQRLDAAAIRAALDQDPLRIARLLLGDENQKMSNATEKRWGQKGASLKLTGAVWYDHAIGIGGDLLSLIQHAKNCDFVEALEIANSMLGGGYEMVAPVARPQHPVVVQMGDRAMVIDIWRGTLPLAGSIAEHYLTAVRRVIIPPTCQDIRFHPACPMHAERLPAMVAAMRNIESNELQAVHRTFLLPDGSAKADVERPKMMLGPSKGAAIKLYPDDELTNGLTICEGIETGLYGIRFKMAPVWALGSAGAIRQFPVIPGVDHLTIAVDNDLGQNGAGAAAVCAERWSAADRGVSLVQPRRLGFDIADLPAPGDE